MSSSLLPFLIPLPLSLLSFSPQTLFTTGAAVGTTAVGRSYTHHHYHWRRLTPIVYVVIAAAVAAAVALLRLLVLRPAAEDEIHTFMPPWTQTATTSMSSLPPATAPRATPNTTTVVIQIHRSW
uniref:Uncharacterized protein n=1 Tax=Oryza barthii TaxID=65489 RepID=A0A0D3G415_9ORYZ